MSVGGRTVGSSTSQGVSSATSQVRRTRIVCTIGPATRHPDMLARLVDAGMDVARLNFSHGTHAEHAAVIGALRAGEAVWGRPVAALQDLQGPKLRLGTFGEGGGERVDIATGDVFTLCARPVVGTAARVSVTHPEYLEGVQPGDRLLLDDGSIELAVDAVAHGDVRCRVVAGGRLSDHKGLALPHLPAPVSCLTEKDRVDLAFGVAAGVDLVAVSFVRSAADLEEVRAWLEAAGARVPLVAKLERREAILHLGEILPLVDAVMVARGDLGLDVPLEDVPHLQRAIIRQARAARVPVIVATQMLESMVAHLRPTRAEVADVAAAIADSADAVMLSAETATGRYPVEAVRTMARVAARAELASPPAPAALAREGVGFSEAVSDAAATAARDLGARAIVAFTQSGFSARLISAERPATPIVAFTPSAAVRRRLTLSWGVTSHLLRRVETVDDVIAEAETALLAAGAVAPGDVVVVISGSPMWVTGTTNLLRLHRIGERR